MTTTQDSLQKPTTPPEIGGIGHSVRRHEDDRFIAGQGNYLDDHSLPGMLHMAILRSPVAHARIRSIDTSAAAAVDGVVAVVTGELLAEYNLAWMPTMSGDTQAVLATDKVRFQGQEVAAVVATDPYIAEDALELIDVDYEILPAITTPQQALADGAVLIRDDKEGQTRNLVYEWESGDAAATEAAFAKADRVVSLETHYPRSHPAPLETCGILADVNSVSGQATIYMTSQAPHAHRTVFAMVAGLPEQNIRIISPDIGGGFGNKVPVYPGYVVATAASLVIGKPVKWVESRTENLISTGFARDYHMKGELALTNEGRILGAAGRDALRPGRVLRRRAADAVPAGLFHVVTGSYDYPAAHVKRGGAYTNKAPGGVAYRCSFRITEASFLIERLVQTAAYELGIDPAEMRFKNFIQPEQFPYDDADRVRVRLRRLPDRAAQGARRGRLRRAARGAGRGTRGRPADRHRHRALHRGGRRGAVEEVRHPRAEDDRLRRAARAPHRQGDPQARREVAGPGPRDDVRPDRGRRARHPGPPTSRWSRATPTTRRTASARTRRARRRSAARPPRWCRASSPTRRRRSPPTCSRRPTPTSSSRTASSRCEGTPDRSVTIQDVALAAYTNLPDGMEYGLEGVHYYDPPNLTYPYGSYVVVVEVDAETACGRCGAWSRSTTAACASTR